MSPELTPSQTVGPFFHDALVEEDRSKLVATGHPSAVRIEGTVYDGAGDPVPDAMVEIWQANQAGRYDDPTDEREDLPLDPKTFSGFGRSDTVEGGNFSFVTVKPGPVPGPDGRAQAPHVMVSVFARGLLKRLVTRVYFPDEIDANSSDPVLCSIEDPKLRDSLIAREDTGVLRFDIHLQGENQTAFFEL
jgi:protocatechuate 3,4-dioxygenase alpha subunit